MAQGAIGGAVLEAAAHAFLFPNKQLTLGIVLLVSEGPASSYFACVAHPALFDTALMTLSTSKRSFFERSLLCLVLPVCISGAT
eukprot:605724-Pelagomonas_calceolata.AAC.8